MTNRLVVMLSTILVGVPLRADALGQPEPPGEVPASEPSSSETTPPGHPPPEQPPPEEPPPSEPVADPVPVDDASPPSPADGSYEALAASLPDDYDLEYKWIPPDKRRAKKERVPREGRQRTPNDRSITSEQAGRMRIAGGTLLGLGIATTVLSVSIGVPLALTARGDAADRAKLAAIAGGSIGGGAFFIGTGLLVAGRKAAREHGDLPPKDKPFAPLTSKQKGNHSVAAALGLLYGVGGLAGGLGLMLCDCSDGKKDAGKALVTLGSISLAIGTYAVIRLGIDKVKRNSTTRLQTAPMFVRGGAGAQLGVRW